ncbi:hypothetical protein DN752_18005 [Echinicola strongylocentroti]|uniref:Uncharacterized protein n=1 Tax=Echinicola strongylocentroti TaxID=1795355 RepID=A0A2Z4ILR5_9BACT|nr:hypothetical protein [Echinicola strongylocentroti]AWW31875.1 hypothetical protein DN752_18005 [Echinicola strongylocentroti]
MAHIIEEHFFNKERLDEDINLMVLEKEKWEHSRHWEIISLSVSFSTRFTPNELIAFGNWLTNHGERIKTEYKSNGKRKEESNG